MELGRHIPTPLTTAAGATSAQLLPLTWCFLGVPSVEVVIIPVLVKPKGINDQPKFTPSSKKWSQDALKPLLVQLSPVSCPVQRLLEFFLIVGMDQVNNFCQKFLEAS